MEGLHAAGSRETRFIEQVFRAFGALVPAEMCSRLSKFISDTGDPKLICKGGARNAVECNAQPVRDPGFRDWP
jgi:hypothetical protein